MSGQKRQSLLGKLISLLTYKPVSRSEFVLPELENENSRRAAPEDKSNLSYESEDSGNSGKEKDTATKKPVRASKWNRVKGEKGHGDKGSRPQEISPDVDVNLEIIKDEFNIPTNIDVIIREFKLAGMVDAFIVFIDGMADRGVVNDFILRQLMNPGQFENYKGGCVLEYVTGNVLSVNQAKKLKKYEEAITQILMGVTVLFADRCDSCLAIETRGYEKRGIEKPATEAVVRGSQEAFTENLKTSVTQIRRIIRNKDLVHEFFLIGKQDNSMASILYIKGIANPDVVKEVKRRLASIETDFIAGDGMLEQFIEDHPWMLVPQVLTTERPDRTAANILDGKVAILTEGTPFAIIVPANFFAFIQTPEDAYLRWQYGTVLRFLRISAFFIALLLPGIYIALTNYHPEMLPTDLAIAISKSREAVPFPSIVEVLLMETSFELIREAGIRVPGLIGTTLGIIGALILGQAAVAANIVSPILIIIVAVTGLGNFAIPNYSLAFGVRILRFFFIILGGIAGFFGISAGLVMLVARAVSIKSFGVPFMAPAWPRAGRSPDILTRYPVWYQEQRPDPISPVNKKRQPGISRGWVKGKPPEGKRE
ncbi:MAG TPA: spore germination protein [Bacillota bacterium]|nr:spore germination protein [Bacillota bacterium]